MGVPSCVSLATIKQKDIDELWEFRGGAKIIRGQKGLI